MGKLNSKLRVLLLAIVLIIISMLCIIINGRTYTLKIDNLNNISSIDELNIEIEQDNDIVKLADKSFKNGILKLKFESVSEGKAYINVNDVSQNDNRLFTLYVHKFEVITFNHYFGPSTFGKIIPVSIFVLLAYIYYLLVKKYKKSMKENMYQYKNILYLGLLIFLFFTLLNQLSKIIQSNYNGLYETIEEIIGLTTSFSIIILPIAFITSIFVTISNIVLIKKEGFSFKNLLGVVLGIAFCFVPFIPDMLYRTLLKLQWVDVFNERSIFRYIESFVEVSIYTGVAYLECILLGTIILGRKAAKRIPDFDKDFIIILGCQIKKDGTLTNLLKARVDRAIEFRNLQKDKTGKELIFVVSGGQGNDEVISEAEAMKNYLLEKGIKEENILVENKSKNTFENIKFSYNLIKNKNQEAKIAFSTTNYHVFRGGVIATNQGVKVEGIGAKTKSYFWINAFIREYVATLFTEKKKHISIICCIIIVAVLMITLQYLANIV